MLILEDVSIYTHNKNVIKSEHICIRDGSVTAITGENESAKSELAHMLGLIASNKDYTYQLDGHDVELTNEEMLSQLKKLGLVIYHRDISLLSICLF